jgi:WD40 repeat protein
MMVFPQSASFMDRCVSGVIRVCVCMVVCFAGSTLQAAEPPVTTIMFAPGGESVVVGSQAGVTAYNWPDLKRQKVLDTSLVTIHDLAFSPNGRMLAAGGGTPSEEGLTELLAWPGGESLGVLSGHEDTVLAVAWRSDAVLATASLDHEIALWEVKSRKQVQRLKGHSSGVTALSFLSEGQHVISGGRDNNLRVWDTASGRMIRTLNNHTREIHQLAVRPRVSGLPMVASGSNDRTVRLWQPTIGRMVRFTRLTSIPLAVAWLPDGSQIAVSCEDGAVRLIDPDTVEIRRKFPAVDGWAYSLAVHPTDGSLLVGGRNGQLSRIVHAARPAE